MKLFMRKISKKVCSRDLLLIVGVKGKAGYVLSKLGQISCCKNHVGSYIGWVNYLQK